jgi:site-specific DNA-methyltransferase (adenine-specific)
MAHSHPRSPLNRTLVLTQDDRDRLQPQLLDPSHISPHRSLPSGTLWGDSLHVAPNLPPQSIDLLILDPPYNLTKNFHGYHFSQRRTDDYTDWLRGIVQAFVPSLKSTASIYICGDWRSSVSIYTVAAEQFIVRNRITWEREKGRGARANWKNASEDIWFCTQSDRYTFCVDAVKLRRRVIAPYRHTNGQPKDWQATDTGNFRDTHPSNFWSDITIPFWSMPENTDHPTQKSEKLLAKLILASSSPGQMILDPFVGSGTTSVVAQKLGRRYLGIEHNLDYCLLTERRLELATQSPSIQGFSQQVFWERNSSPPPSPPRE